jgi:hypothetical protein
MQMTAIIARAGAEVFVLWPVRVEAAFRHFHEQRHMGGSRVSSDSISELERELYEAKGALDLLFTLREEFAQWVEEAQDDSKQEALENVLGHIEALEGEYRVRQEELQKKLDTA